MLHCRLACAKGQFEAWTSNILRTINTAEPTASNDQANGYEPQVRLGVCSEGQHPPQDKQHEYVEGVDLVLLSPVAGRNGVVPSMHLGHNLQEHLNR